MPVTINRKYFFQLAVLFACYFLTAHVGLKVDAVGGFASLVWPPAGIALAGFLLGSIELWPAIFFAAFAVNYLAGAPIVGAFGVATGNTLSGVAAAAALLNLFKFRKTLERVSDVLIFLFVAVIMAPLISASFGVFSLWLSSNIQADLRHMWSIWWAGDALGILIFSPFILIWSLRPGFRPTPGKILEAMAMVVSLLVVCLYIFIRRYGPQSAFDDYYFVLFPILTWMALRFAQMGAVSASFVVASLALWATVSGTGPFAKGQLHENLAYLSGFLAAFSVTGLMVAAITRERMVARNSLREANVQLEKKVEIQAGTIRENEQVFRRMVEGVKDYAIFMLDAKGIITTWNTGARNLKQYEASEVIGKHFSIFYTEKDILEGKAELELVEAAKHGSFEDEGYRIRKDGTRFWANVIINAIYGDNGEVIGYVKITRDLTERKQMEISLAQQVADRTQELAASRDQLDVILKGITDGITVLDENGNFIFANLAGAQMCGFSSVEEFLATPASEVMKRFEIRDENGYPFPTELLPGRRALRGEPEGEEVIVRFRFKGSNEEKWSIIKASPIFDKSRNVRMAVSIFKDFTGRKKIEDSLKNLDEASRVLSSSLDYVKTLEQIAQLAVPRIADWCSISIREPGQNEPRQVTVHHKDPEMLVLASDYNKKFPTDWSSNYGLAHVYRTGISELHSDVTNEMLRASIEDDEHYRIVSELGIKSVIIVPLVSRGVTYGVISLVLSDSGRRYNSDDLKFAEELARRCGAAIDNSLLFSEVEKQRNDYRQAHLKMEKLAMSAAAANQVKSLFLANMSHEIRTPLGAILGFIDLLNDPSISEEERKKYTDIIGRNGQQLTQLIDDILDLSKVEAGHLDIESIETSLTTLLSDVTTLMGQRCYEKGLGFVVEKSPNLPDKVYTDPTRLRQILINIIGNAIKFTSEGEVSIKVSAEDEKPDRTQKVIITVRDTGLGISAENKERIFEWFTQADPSTTRKFGGTGLGLALSRQLARALGGDIVLNEKYETGSEFIITFTSRYHRELPTAQVQPKPVSKRSNPELEGTQVLLVEDSADNRMLIENLLKRNGVKVDTAENGRVGVDKALSRDYDLVLMDIQMPVLDGLQAAAELRAKNYKKPIVALTAHAMKEEREKTIAAGCNTHLTKPIQFQKLLGVISEYTRGSREHH